MGTETKVIARKKNKLKVYIPLFLITIIILTLGWYWYKDYSKYITTDDAYVDSDNVSISSKILGRIIHEYAMEGDSVKKGMLIAILDSTDLLAQKNQTIAMKEQAITTKSQTEASYQYDQESIKVLQVSLDKAQEDYDRAKVQYEGSIITKESFEHSTKALEAAKAQFNASKAALFVSKAKIESAASAVRSSEAQVITLETQLKNTKLYSPMDGVIAKRWLLPGEIVAAGQSIFTITNNEKYWVIVYLEETNISKIHNGQKVFFKIDAYSGISFIGKIFNIGSNTASQFSLIPPNNAAGNFTKITQRVPVKISIDETKNGDKVTSFKLLAGMSAEVKILKD